MFILIAALAAAVFILIKMGYNESNFHIAGYSATTGAAVTNSALTPINDGVLTVSGTSFIFPAEAQMPWAFGTAVLLGNLRLNTPSLREVGLPSLVPVNTSATVPSPANIVDLTAAPIKLPKVDGVGVDATDSQAAGEFICAVIALQFKRKPVPPGLIYRLRGTAAITSVQGSWVSGAITLDQSLPQGIYSVVGLDVVGANLIAARLVFAGAGWRPGVICRNADGSKELEIQQQYAMGEFGRFENVNLPNLEVLRGAGGANTAQVVYLDVIRVGDISVQPPGY